MLRNAVGIVVGIVIGMIAMMALHFLSMLVYPLPEGVDFMSADPANEELLKEWFASLPAGAFLLATAAHGLGCMAGAAAAMLISGRRSLAPAIIVGLFFTIGGIANLFSVPHPAWFPVLDIPIYLALAYLAGRVLRNPDPAEDTELAEG